MQVIAEANGVIVHQVSARMFRVTVPVTNLDDGNNVWLRLSFGALELATEAARLLQQVTGAVVSKNR